MMPRTGLQRHRLAWLHDAAWAHVLAGTPWDAQARACLRHWRANQLPLVVARQPASSASATARIHLGLAMPSAWGRGRLGVAVTGEQIRKWGQFPPAQAVTPLLPQACRAAWRRQCMQWRDAGCQARVYGGYGWQWLTGLAYLRETSDLDVLLPVRDARHADRIVAEMLRLEQTSSLPRLDGELVFPDHRAISWREWRTWRSGAAQAVLVKRIDGLELRSQPWDMAAMNAPQTGRAHAVS